MKQYGFASRIARIFLCAHFCVFSYLPAMQLPPVVQQQIINASSVRSAVQEVQREVAYAAWQSKSVDVKQALAQSEKFQSALTTAIDAEYKKWLTATEKIAKTGSQEVAKTAASQALKKIPKDKPSSFSRYAKIAAIAALAAVVVAYGGVSLSERQGSAVGPWTQQDAPAPAVMSPHGAVSNVSLPFPTAGVVSPEISALLQQGGGEGAAWSPYESVPKTPEISKNFPNVVGESGALFTHKKTSKTLNSALADLIKIQGDRPTEQLLLVDEIGDLSGVLFSTIDSNVAQPNTKHGWVYYFDPQRGLCFAEWSYKFDPKEWFNKETFDIQKRASGLRSQENYKYTKLLENMREKLPPYNINQNIPSEFVRDAFKSMGRQPQGVDPIEWLKCFAGSRDILLKSYGQDYAQSSFDQALTSILDPQLVSHYMIALFDALGDSYYENVIIEIEAGHDHLPLDRWGYLYYKKAGKTYFATWNTSPDRQDSNAVIFKPEGPKEVTDSEEIGRYEKLYAALKSYDGKSFEFSELPFEKIYGTK